MRKLNRNGLNLIKEFEGCKLKAYKDSVGVPTIGYGHTRGVKMGDVITQKQADDIFESDINIFAAGVEDLIDNDVTDNEFAALVSLAFNIGLTNFKRSSLLRLVNHGDFDNAANQFLVWNKAGGRVLPGLTRRRKAERALFLKPDSQLRAAASDAIQHSGADEEIAQPSIEALEASASSPAIAEAGNVQPAQTVESGGAGVVIQPSALTTPELPIIPSDAKAVDVETIEPTKTGAKKSLWATIIAGITYLALNVQAFFTNAYEAVKGNPVLAVGLVIGCVTILVVYWKYQDRQTKLDEQREKQAFELTKLQMELAANQTKYSVNLVKSK